MIIEMCSPYYYDCGDEGAEMDVEGDSINQMVYVVGKQCASCGTKKTPLWRDAEDGTSLCNACGIR